MEVEELLDMEDSQNLIDTQRKGDHMVISLSLQAFEELLALGLDINHIYLLENPDINLNNPKVLGWRQTLARKGYINGEGVSSEGKALLEALVGVEKLPTIRKKIKREVAIGDFERWWKEYPATDTFTYKDRTFKGTRALRVNKNECQVKFGAVILAGKYTADQMIAALVEEKKYKMEDSLRTRQNKMSFFKNSLTYLNQGTYEPWIELLGTEELTRPVVNDGETKRVDI